MKRNRFNEIFRVNYGLLLIVFSFLCLNVSAAPTDESYIIKRGDVLEINVMEHPEFSVSGITVMPDGCVQFPGLGAIPAAGMTLTDFTKVMQKNVEKYVVNPVLTVFISRMPSQIVSVVGYVNRPGEITVYEPVNLIEALSKAGGIKNVRKCKWVTIIRADQSFEKIRVKQLFAKNKKIDTPVLNVGDTVYVVEPRDSFNWSMLSFFTTLSYVILQLVLFLN